MTTLFSRRQGSTGRGGQPVRRASTASSNVAIGVGTAFVLATAAVALVFDRPPPRIGEIGAGWHLRGALGASVPPAPGRPRAAAHV